MKARAARTLLRGIACDSATTLGLVYMSGRSSAIQGTDTIFCRPPITATMARSQHATVDDDDGRLHVPLFPCATLNHVYSR